MANALILQTIHLLAAWTIGTPLFIDAVKAVQKWEADHRTRILRARNAAEQRAVGRETQDRVIEELELAGYSLAAKTAMFAIELALQFVKRLA